MEIPAVLGPTIELNLTTHLPTTPLPKIDTSLPTLLYTSYNLDPYWRVHEKANRILLLEPSHFKKHPVSERVLHFILELAKNIENIQVFSGELYELLEVNDNHKNDPRYISKEHPLFQHFPGTKDPRDWIYPEVTGYYPSFFSYWRQCQKALKNRAGLS
jgi:deoxyribodipyrimidine photo-lyase